jgi:CheY-like chemotaxis protein
MNLGTNAGMAMRERGGTLELSLTEEVLGLDDIERFPDLEEGRHLRLTVSDTGCGMTPAVQERIFEPFFTTRSSDEGTGMGLSVVHGIVRRCGGAINVDSAPGEGATFHVLLPVFDARQAESANDDVCALCGTERILFVDDEEAQVRLAKKGLERLGYRVAATLDPVKAIEMVRSRPREFDVVISDVTMPQVPGDLFAREVLSIRPDLPLILCTGYSERVKPGRFETTGAAALVSKPMSMAELAAVIRKVVD